jgi:hypothetical protein
MNPADVDPIAAKYGGVPADNPFFRFPVNVQSLARQLVDYKIPMPAGFALARPNSPWNAALQAAVYLDPTFDATQYGARYALRRDFTSGNGAKALNSLNMTISHLNDLNQKADALNNRQVPAWNAVGNWLLTQEGGDPRVTNFNVTKNAVANELTRLFRGTGGAEADIQAWNQNINSSESPAQLKGAVETALHLLAGRAAALEDQWNKGIGKPRDFHFLSDQSKKIIGQLGYDPESVEHGEVTTIDQQKAANPQKGDTRVYQGHTYQFDGTQWVKQ